MYRCIESVELGGREGTGVGELNASERKNYVYFLSFILTERRSVVNLYQATEVMLTKPQLCEEAFTRPRMFPRDSRAPVIT